MVRLQTEPIRVETLVGEIRGDEDGAVEVFLGTVRNHNAGRRVLYLEYHAYPGMAEGEMAKLEHEAVERYGVSRVAIVHRTGRLEIGEVSVAIVVASPHRAPAQDACRFVIDTLKKTVPIWKKEYFEGGTVWIEGERSG
ncbi:MAG: molybdenum cofactor biosynthesis protein MoaE [Acidobacteriota bacterium]|nr:molybdenum cofactor biosynthesis protein MoaE [Acidobacteriota bacterium]